MSFEFNPEDVKARLLSYIGESYQYPDGCVRFLVKAYREFGFVIDGVPRDLKKFRRVEQGSLGTMVLFQALPFSEYHTGIMLDRRWCIQSASVTNGVARIEITRMPWCNGLRGFYRPRIFGDRCF